MNLLREDDSLRRVDLARMYGFSRAYVTMALKTVGEQDGS